ncbi:Uma2 family endonuclease [Microcoleus sp. herbarium2]|uniref:Uma2 family endonuclease n=1 Tax=Microcoleus sp. herbarium2 TaxID=3055433 RepID=UPI002FD5B01F
MVRIQALIDEDGQTPEQKADLFFEQGLLYWFAEEYAKAIVSYDKALEFKPDSVIDRSLWRAERKAYAEMESPIQLAVEVVSTNWEDDDYVDKLDEHERLGIAEYWIIDYLAIDKREYLGNPKIPTVFVFSLDAEGKYHRTQFRDNEQIVSPTFPELVLTAAQVLSA